MKKLFFLSSFLFLFFLFSLSSQAQDRTITGTVTDAATNEPLPGVNIAIIGSSGGTSTGADGNYALTVSAADDSLQFSFIGFKTQRVAINGRRTINVTMRPSTQKLGEELVVTAFGIEQSKKSLGYSTQNVSGEEISETEQTNVVSALQGKLAGVQIQNSSGAVGAGSNILIRGITSLNPGADNQPLFIVDGIPVSNETISTNVLPSSGSNAANSAEQFSFTNRAADINPDDIASINVLKGPGATALYGVRAANGVIVIETKSGSEGPTNVNFKTSVGASDAYKFPGLQDDYREGRFGRLRFNSDGSPLRFQTFGPPRGNDPFFNNFNNFFRTGQSYKNYVSVSGGSDKATYFTSVSRNDEIGIVPNTDFGKTTALLRGSTQFGDRLNVTGSVQYTNSGGTRPNGGDKSIMSALSYYSPTFDVNDYIDENGNERDFSDGIIDNPRYLAEVSTLQDNVNRMIGNVGFNYTFTDWLFLDYKIGLDYYNDARSRIAPPGLDVSSQVNGYVAESTINSRELNSNLIITAQHTFNEDLSGTFKIGNNVNQRQSSLVSVRGEGYTLPNFNDLSNTTNFFTSENQTLRRIVGAFADFQFNYREMLFLTVTARNDWSSTLPEENRSFFYPSASLSYIFTESFNNDDSILDYGKLRYSWSRVGKDASPYQIGRYFSTATGFPFGGVNGFEISSIAGSQTLKPEETVANEVGANLVFFGNRLDLDVSLYQNRSMDQIFSIPVSNATGLSRLITNAGEIRNRGVEVLVQGTPFQRNDFSWNLSLNWSTSRGTVQSLPEGIDEIVFYDDRITNKLVRGGNVGDLYGWEFQRNDQGQLLIGEDGLPSVDFDQGQVKVGNAIPEWQGGITNTFNYKNTSLSFLIEVRQGGDAYDLGLRNRIRNGIDERTAFRYEQVVFNGVTADGTPNEQPVEITGENYYRFFGINNAAELLLQDASWVRLRNLSISYSLPTSVTERLPLRRASFSLTGNNLFLSTPFRGFDPEGQQFGSGSNAYGFTGLNIPSTRSVTFAINLLF